MAWDVSTIMVLKSMNVVVGVLWARNRLGEAYVVSDPKLAKCERQDRRTRSWWSGADDKR